jgi:hypothetical protein
MSHSADALYKMSEAELLAAYAEARREFVEKKFARDTQRARLAWIRAKMFTSSSGGVTERNMAIDVSEEIARKGQEVREMTRDLDLVKVEVDIIASVIRFRGAPAPAGGHGEDASEGDSGHDGDRAASDWRSDHRWRHDASYALRKARSDYSTRSLCEFPMVVRPNS